MSTASENTNVQSNQNDATKHKDVKKIDGEMIKPGGALGISQNRVPQRTGGNKVGEKNLNRPKMPSLRDIKPRVDTRWRKDVETENTETNSDTKTTVPQSTAQTGGTVGTISKNIQPPKVVLTQTKNIKTVTKKRVENKFTQDKIINREKPGQAQEAKVVKTRTQNSAAKDVKDKPGDSIDKIRNIDEGDTKSLVLVSQYVNEINEYLFNLEIEFPIRQDHLDGQKAVTPRMRAVLMDWINEIHWQFQLVSETFHMTVSIVDRYLQVVKDTERSKFQLVGLTALILAAKYEEYFAPPMADCVFITDYIYTRQQIFEMEIKVLRSLDYNLSRPVCIQFLRRYSKAAEAEDIEYSMAKYFLELAAIEYKLAAYRPSEIAAASLFLSMHMHKGDPEKASGFNNAYWDRTLEYYSHYNATYLRPIARNIAKIARHAPKAKLQAVYKKYQSPKLFRVSLCPELYSRLMDSLVKSDD